MLRESDKGAADCGPGPQRRWRPRLAHASGVGGEGPPDKYSSMIAGTRLFFVMAGQVGRAGRKGREPLLLPLLHVLHLQAEGGEAGQEVGHLIHLQDRSKALSQGVRTGSGLLLITTGLEGRHSLSSQGRWWLHCDYGNRCPRIDSQHQVISDYPREKGHEQFQRKWVEALRSSVGCNPTAMASFYDEGLAASEQGWTGPEAPARPWVWTCGCGSPALWCLSSGGECTGRPAGPAARAAPGAPGTPSASG